MNLTKTGNLIRKLRCEKGLTQKNVAEKLGICDKTVSKWERGHGFPDVSLILKLSEIFEIDIAKLLDGEIPQKKLQSGNVKRTKFYYCKDCNNLITSMGDAEIICCGRKLQELRKNKPNDAHTLNISEIEDEFYVTFSHPMTKEHYISFVSYVRYDRLLTVRLYPEQGGELRFPKMRGGKMYYYCNQHGLFEI